MTIKRLLALTSIAALALPLMAVAGDEIPTQCPDGQRAVCHLSSGERATFATMCVTENSVKKHRLHGDTLGTCEGPRNMKRYSKLNPAAGKALKRATRCATSEHSVCHRDSALKASNWETQCVATLAEVKKHLAHGDVSGVCPSGVIVAQVKQGKRVRTSDPAPSKDITSSGEGCPPGQALVCHSNARKKIAPVDRCVKLADVATHLKHGDSRGSCTSSIGEQPCGTHQTVVCHTDGVKGAKTTMCLSGSDLKSHLDHGDKTEACPKLDGNQ